MISRSRGVALGLASQVSAAVGSAVIMVVLARALSTQDRGLVSAVVAPALLIAATFPSALIDPVTYFVARAPRHSGAIVRKALVLGLALTALGILAAASAAPFLTRGHAEVRLLMIELSLTSMIGCLLVVLRAEANARRHWYTLALDSLVSNAVRPMLLVLLWAFGALTVSTAGWVMALAGFAGIALYLPLPWRRGLEPTEPVSTFEASSEQTSVSYAAIVKFGLGSWVGVISASSLGFFDQLLMTPLAGPNELAYYAVAMGIANLVGTVSVSVRSVVFATEAAGIDWKRIAQAARLCLIITSAFALVVGTSAPYLLPRLLGHAYVEALVPLLILLVSTVALSCGTIVTAGLAAAGKPHLRAVAVAGGALCNAVLVVALVPRWGATGAAIAMLANVPLSAIAVRMTRGFHELSLYEFVFPRLADAQDLARAIRASVSS